MTVLFGTVEYFESEIVRFMAKDHTWDVTKEDLLKAIYSSLEKDVLYDFVCDEGIRIECLHNLTSAFKKFDHHVYV